MSHDPRSPSDAADHDPRPINWTQVHWRLHDAMQADRTGCCAHCDEPFEDETPNVEAFEITGQLLCDLCAEAAMEEADADV